jgi:hypothetical protein
MTKVILILTLITGPYSEGASVTTINFYHVDECERVAQLWMSKLNQKLLGKKSFYLCITRN